MYLETLEEVIACNGSGRCAWGAHVKKTLGDVRLEALWADPGRVRECDGPTLASDRHTPGAPDVWSFLTRKSLGRDPILRNFWVKMGRKGTRCSDREKQEEEPEKNETPKETKATSGMEEKMRTDPQTGEQEDIGPPVAIGRRGGPEGHTPKLPPCSGKSVAYTGVWVGLNKIKRGGGNQGGKKRGRNNWGCLVCYSFCFVWWCVPFGY
ncbi:hypothetical protein NDU88_005349 [Pleurodeles waltl]|uniref:Uncharacterized protein n=1 Tax=Pleurodeles waltl TaxID=8319 RepID=A0AAV7RJX1_PLEWA|nr:hypothetical protein NDU88_005349 [Pleurodeles waltl]